MRSCDRALVVETLAGKRVALVGSGPGVLDNAPGVIDGYEVVVRVNNYKLSDAAGYRCDVFYSFFGSSIRKTADELRRDGVRLCMAKCPNAKFIESEWHVRRRKMLGVDFRAIYRRREGFWFCPVYVPTTAEFMAHFDLLGKHVPTTGFASLLDILACGPAEVYMTGFDFFSSGVHNVNERWRPGDPTDPIGHDPKAEHAWFVDNARRLPLKLDAVLTRILDGRWTEPPKRAVPPPRNRRMTRARQVAVRAAARVRP